MKIVVLSGSPRKGANTDTMAEAFAETARETGAIVTSEEHNVLGGLGGAVAEVVGEEYPVPVLRHGMRDCFGKSGKHDDVLALFGLTETVLADTVKSAVALKK